MNRSWIYVYVSGIVEILWTIGLKYSNVWWEWVLTFLVIILSFVLTLKASETLPVATVYVVFTGIGAVGTNLVDILVFREPVSILKIVFIMMLIAGIIGLKMVTDDPGDTAEVAGVPLNAEHGAGGCSDVTAQAGAGAADLEMADSKHSGEVR